MGRTISCYRITLVGDAWHVVRPARILAHAYDDLDQAMEFVRKDCGEAGATVELLADGVYIVKQVAGGG